MSVALPPMTKDDLARRTSALARLLRAGAITPDRLVAELRHDLRLFTRQTLPTPETH